MLFKRSLFFLVVMSLTLSGSVFGIAGGYAVGERLLGAAVMNAHPYYLTSWATWVELALLSVGALIGFCGVLMLLVFPLYFLCPNARLPFSWQRKDARWEKNILGWYARHLQNLANSLSIPN
jgi:hypothetical protein